MTMETNSEILEMEKGLEQQQGNEQLEDSILELRQEKAKVKKLFTKARRRTLLLIQEKDVTVEVIKNACEDLDEALANVMDTMTRLADAFRENRDRKNGDKLSQEIEKVELEYSNAQDRVQHTLDELNKVVNLNKLVRRLEEDSFKQSETIADYKTTASREVSKSEDLIAHQQSEHVKDNIKHHPGVVREGSIVKSKIPTVSLHSAVDHQITVPERRAYYPLDEGTSQNMADSALIGQDLWKQFKRVSIPVFSGDKRTYSNWKAAFLACVDQAPATPEYKLLQLRQCLAGEALKTIESLGHSAGAYQAAKERLEQKFGGQRRQIAIYLEEIDSFKPVQPGNYKDIEKFADLLNVAIVNLKETHYPEELRDGMLYIKLQKKLPTQMLAAYHRWVFENYRIENVEVLREWIVQEAEFQMRAIETVQGLSTGRHGKPETRSHGFREPHQTFFGRSNAKLESGESQGQRSCRVCNKQHGTWTCDEFKQLYPEKVGMCKKIKTMFPLSGRGSPGPILYTYQSLWLEWLQRASPPTVT